MATQILRNIVGRLLGLDQNNDLVMAGSKIYIQHGSNLDVLVDLQAMPRIITNGGIPTGKCSSGSFANNGALSGITAFPFTFADCYLSFPAGAIFAGSAAGFYYTQMSSTSAGTVFNNTYTSGTPNVPAILVPFVCTGPGAFTQTTGAAEQQTLFTVPGNSMGKNGSWALQQIFSYNNSAGTKAFSVRWGGQNSLSISLSTSLSTNIVRTMTNAGKTGVQFSEPTAAVGPVSASAGDGLTFTKDTAVDQTVATVLNMNTATDFGMILKSTLIVYPQFN